MSANGDSRFLGEKVELRNIVSDSTMNGRRGRVTALDEETGRWVVELKLGRDASGKKVKRLVKIKAENLLAVPVEGGGGKSSSKAELRELARAAKEESRRKVKAEEEYLPDEHTAASLVLLKAGAKKESRDQNGDTPADLARKNGHGELEGLLLSHDAGSGS